MLVSVVRARVLAEAAKVRSAQAVGCAEQANAIARRETAKLDRAMAPVYAGLAKMRETPEMREHRIAVMTKAFGR